MNQSCVNLILWKCYALYILYTKPVFPQKVYHKCFSFAPLPFIFNFMLTNTALQH